MAINPIIETEEDLQLVRSYILLPVLSVMLQRDIDRLMSFSDKVIFGYLIYNLKEMEKLIHPEARVIEEQMKSRGIKVLHLETTIRGIDVSYLVRGTKYSHTLLRDLVKVEIMIMFSDLWRRL